MKKIELYYKGVSEKTIFIIDAEDEDRLLEIDSGLVHPTMRVSCFYKQLEDEEHPLREISIKECPTIFF